MVAEVHGKDSIIEYYRHADVVEEYQGLRAGNLFRKLRTELHAEKINGILAEQKVSKLLEVGIGTARISRNLQNFEEAWGVDASANMLKEAKKVLDVKWTLKKCDAFRLPFKNNEFDAIVSTRFTWHFNKEDRKKLFDELQRVMKPGAIIITDALNAEVKRYGFKKTRLKGMVFTFRYTPETVKKEFESYGFGEVRVFPIMWFFSVIRALSGRECGKKLYFLLRILSRVPVGKPYDYLVVARKR